MWLQLTSKFCSRQPLFQHYAGQNASCCCRWIENAVSVALDPAPSLLCLPTFQWPSGSQPPGAQAPKAGVWSVKHGRALQVSFLQALSMIKLYTLPPFFHNSNGNHQTCLCLEKKKVEININWLDNFLSVRLKQQWCLLNIKFL